MNQTVKILEEYLLQCHHELQQRDEAIARLKASRISMHQKIETVVWENSLLRNRLGDLEQESSQHRDRAHASTHSRVPFRWRHRSASC
jgi:chromosome segregation ATPase